MNSGEIDWNATQVVFLSLVWAGGVDYDLTGLVEIYDWVNHSIPSREEIQSALNVLLAMHLIEEREGRYSPVPSQKEAFESLRKKNHKNKFDTVRMFFEGLPQPEEISNVVSIEESEFRACLKSYLGKFHSL